MRLKTAYLRMRDAYRKVQGITEPVGLGFEYMGRVSAACDSGRHWDCGIKVFKTAPRIHWGPCECPCHAPLSKWEPSSLNATPDPEADKRVEPDCGARTLIGDSFVACDKEHTHYGAHRVVLPDGRIVKWEPLPPEPERKLT